jgi:Ser/Thr protein kinase RdoA (MazF antagonist)
MTAQLERFLTRVLREPQVLGDRSWPHGDTRVLEVRDREGTSWFAKEHRLENRYRREVTAYRRWVPALHASAPSMLACDDELRVVIISRVPGEIAVTSSRGFDAEVQRRAGELLRRFHEAEPSRPWTGFAAEKREKLEAWATRAAGLLSARELDFARALARGLEQVDPPRQVPCHRDYSPRNWLVDGDNVRVIDFDLATWEVWVNDLARLYFGIWWDRPDLRDAFLDGYGHGLDRQDLEVLLRCGAIAAISPIARAHEHGDSDFEEAGRRNLQRLMRRPWG